MLSHIATTATPDVVFWTGDNSPHNVWDNTYEEVTNYTDVVTQAIKDAFEGLEIPVYPTLGNHEAWPDNIQDFTTPNTNYLINNVKESWSDWLD